MKTSELTGAALDWAVAKCEGCVFEVGKYAGCYIPGKPHYNYSTDWEQGGPIIEREQLEFDYDEAQQVYGAYNGTHGAIGKTHLIAAMRAFVTSKLGYEITLPENLK